MSAARAFLRPAMKRSNVRVEINALATRILFEGKRAVGVEYHQNGETKTARAGREVILSGGSINSRRSCCSFPGSARRRCSALSASRRPCQRECRRQTCRTMSASTTPSRASCRRSTRSCAHGGASSWSACNTSLMRSGPLSLSMNNAGGFFRTDPAIRAAQHAALFPGFSTVIPKSGERPILTPDPWPGFSIGLSNCRPSSRGEIMIRLRTIRATIRRSVANACSTEADVAEMLAAVKFVRKIAAMPAMAEIIEEEVLPGPSITSDADLIQDFRKRSGTVYHPVSTCRMGPDATAAVVDPRLQGARPRGLAGHRRLDLSR